MEIYLHQDGERAGPFTLENVQGQLEAGQLTVSDAAWFEGCEDWVTVQDVPGIMLPGGDHLVEVATVPPFEAYQGDEPFVFISYAHKDAAVVYEEITRLHEAGVNLWYDEGIEASNEWPEEIANAVIDCTALLVFVSPRATASVNCRNEINLALNKNKPFLAIYLEATELPPGLQLRMGDLQAILRYKLPVDRYQKKTQDSLDQLLGKKPKKKRTAVPFTQQTEGTPATAEPAEQAAQTDTTTAPSKPQRKGLAVALAALLLIACGALGYLFLGDDGEETSETSTATFTPGEPWTVPTASIEMLWCKPGTFLMGSPESEEGHGLDYKGKKKFDETRHQVTLTKGFYLGKYEVTQAQWKKVMGTSPSKFFGERRPVEQVNWSEALRFCQELTLLERKAGRLPDGWEYALPTEAQWEYACRAGTTTAFASGNSFSSKQANFNGTEPYGGAVVGPNLQETNEVGSYAANSWGFFDMHGNVKEWCADWYANFSAGSFSDPTGTTSGSNRVTRGGSWYYGGYYLRSAGRHFAMSSDRSNGLGFRLSLWQTKPGTAPKGAVVITDKALEAALRKSLNKPTGPITPADLASIESLHASKLGIIDVAPLAHCPNLATLFLSDNQITYLTPLAHCSKLRDLELGGNQITDLRPLSGLTKLTRLRLYRNRVTDIAPLAGVTSLVTLYLDQNQITDFTPLSRLTKLQRLYLWRTQIADLKPLSSLRNMTWLYVEDNQITDLSPLAGLTKLNELHLSRNPITDFAPLAKLTNLTELSLKEIQITDAQKDMLRKALPKCEIAF